jgi:type II secretory pathway pseudopilin PulG
LIELLVVIAIIGILAGLLLPTLAKGKSDTKKRQAKMDMASLTAAISQYEIDYSRMPGVTPNGLDITYGYATSTNNLPTSTANIGIYTNSDLMCVLMDINAGINFNHAKNPRNVVTFNARQNSDTTSPGLSTIDNQLRDPWGHSYVITLDMNGDNLCQDALYSLPAVANPGGSGTQGLMGLQDYNGTGVYQVRGSVMIWSEGPDGLAPTTDPANAGGNKDNILSWQ